MDPTILLNKPKTPNIVPKITKISNLSIASGQARKSSTKLVKVFEKGTYQKKTQLTVLNRYKKRLESIQKQNDRSFGKKRKVKVKLPDIKKYVGSFFTPGSTNDPLKAIGALAAFNAFQKGSKGDWGGALGSGLVAFGLLGGGALGIKTARAMFKGRGAATAAGAGKGGVATPPWWMKNTKSLGRSNESYARYIAGEANIGDRARLARRGMIPASGVFSRGGTDVLAKQAGKPLAKTALKKFGGAILPGVGAAFSFQTAKERDKAGDKFGSAIDNIAGSLDAFAAGVQIAAGASAATGIGIPAAGIIELAAGVASIGSFGLDMFNLFRDLTGQSDKEAQKNKLQQQTEKQKALVEKKKDEGGKLTFSKTLNSYDKAVKKFEEFSKGFTGLMTPEQVRQTAARIEDLGGGSEPISGPGYEFTNQDSFSQYLTGDVNAPSGAYDPSHGTVDNYHDHFAFKDRETAHRAAAFLQSKGITVTELDVSGGHSDGSAHYQGRAFDVPGYQWGGSGAIGPTEYRGSAKVRALMNDFYNLQTQQPTASPSPSPTITPSSLFQRSQTPALSIGQGGFRINGAPAASLSQARPRRMPQVSQNLPYQEEYAQVEPMIVPYPVVRQQQMAASAPSAPMMFPGPSEQQLLNSFYKKVLLNTVQ